jgi:hypothetical protein
VGRISASGRAGPLEVAREILGLAESGRLTLFVGSFVSARSPAGLPMAADLKDAILAALWRGSRERLSPALGGSPRSLLRGSQWPRLPLEMVAEAVLRATELSPDRLLSFLGEASPNFNHAVLASMADRGLARLVTTNFDELIEASRSRPGDGRGLRKPHGTFAEPEEMAIRLSQVGRGIVAARLRRSLEADLRGRDLCFVGYSGRDLDIRPILKSQPIRSVLWIARPPLPGEPAADARAARDRVEALFDARTPVRCVRVDGDELFDALGRELAVAGVSSTGARPWRRTLAAALRDVPWHRQAMAVGHVLNLSGCPQPAGAAYRVVELARVPAGDAAFAALRRGEASYRRQDYAEGKAAVRKARDRYRRLGDDLGLAQCHQLLG